MTTGVNMTRVLWLTACISIVSCGAGCDRGGEPDRAADTPDVYRVAVSNSYLEAAVMELLGDREPILRLAGPGMCPGHFDVRPSQINALRHCRLLLALEFQASLSNRLEPLAEDGLDIRSIRTQGGLCEPPVYVAALRQVADTLVAAGLIDAPLAEERCRTAERRIASTGESCRDLIRRTGWSGRAVLCSVHQEGFCRWLGLEVAGTFSGGDSATVGQIDEAVRAGEVSAVAAVIANLPEGRRLADALGQRLGADVVVFGNFPVMDSGDSPFDALLMSNVTTLVGEPTR